MEAALRGDSQGGAHLGLANIATRLRLIYGGRATLRVDAEEAGRTRVIIEVPQDRPREGREGGSP